MEHVLFVANLLPGTTSEQVHALFVPAGTVLEAKVQTHPNVEKPTESALVHLETETPLMELLDQYNGQLVEGKRLAVSPLKPQFPLPKTTQEQKDLARQIAARLGESQPAPCRQILRLVRVCGSGFAQTVLADALDVESGGGLMVLDGSRRRTQGGVFFYLARGRMSYEIQGVIFPRGKNKRKNAQQAQPDAQTQPDQKPPKGDKKAKGKANHTGRPHPAAEGVAESGGEKVSPPPPPPDLDSLRAQLDQLRQAHSQAQQHLTALQAQKGAKSVGTFSAIKQVFDLQRQIDEILKAYPQLK